jgi:hypothetical protein
VVALDCSAWAVAGLDRVVTRAARTSQWARRFVFAGALFLVAWQAAILAGVGRRPGLLVGLLGFVFHTVFGKAYSLLPSYFDRELATTRTLPMHLLCSVAGTVALAVGLEFDLEQVETAGAVLWLLAVSLFVATLGWTISDNPVGTETGTGEHNADRAWTDRFANRFILVAVLYLLVGSYELLAVSSGLPPLFDGYAPRAIHLLAAGTGAIFVFAVGFRLLPRFFATATPQTLAVAVLPAGAVGPAVIAASLPAGDLLHLGATLEAIAVAGFAVAVAVLFVRTDRDRIGFYGVLAAAGFGLVGVSLGLLFAFDGLTLARLGAHTRVNVLGFLGLTIVGVSYQFYPPAVATFRGGGDRTALMAMGLLAAGLLVEVAGTLLEQSLVTTVGQAGTLAGAAIHLFLLGGLFSQRSG